MNKLRVTEIFYSLQGEAKTVGVPTVFVRLTGCPLRCQYCDTAYAFSGGKVLTINEIMETVDQYQARYVTVTGGEPLVQPSCLELLKRLCDHRYCVSLETSGALDVAQVDKRVIKVLDVKTPASLESKRNRFENIDHLTMQDQVKFVICDELDYQWSKNILARYNLVDRCEVLFSPSHGELDNQKLAEWILKDKLPVRFQIQMHKYIWGDVRGK